MIDPRDAMKEFTMKMPDHSLRLACVMTVCVLLTACPFDKPEDHLARGKEQAAKQDHAAAAIEFKNYLQSVPRSAEGRFLLGRELLAQGEARAAEIELQKAYDGRYDRDQVTPLLVEAQVRQGDPDKISAQIAKTELKTPQANARLQAMLGKAALLKGNLEDALKAFRAAQQYEPGLAAARLGEARVDAMRGEMVTASALVAAVMEKEPANVDALMLKGDIALKKNTRQDAIDAYLGVIALDPRNLQSRLNLSGIYMSTGEVDLAQKQVDEMKKLAPRHPGVTYMDALIAFSKKDFLRANDAITLSLNGNTRSGAAQILSGAISLAMKQPVQAEAHLIEGLKLTPDSVNARRILADIYLRQNQPQKASEVIQPALVGSPDDSTLLGLAGEIALQQGDYAKASKFFDRSSSLDPSNTDTRVKGAVADLARGDEAGGFAALEAAVKANSNSPSPDIALIMARLNRRQFDQALVTWAGLEKLQPDNPVTYNIRGAIDLGRNDRIAARAALEHAIKVQANYFPAVRNLSALDEEDGKLDAARQRYKTLLEKDKTNTAALISLADFEARHNGSPDNVVALLQEARRSNLNAEEPLVTLASYLVSQGKAKQALSVVQEAHDRDPTNLTYMSMIGDLQLQTGGVDQAIAAFRQLTSAKPGVFGFQFRLGQALVVGNQADLAVGVFQKAFNEQPGAFEAEGAAISMLIRAKRTNEANQLLLALQKISPRSPFLTEIEGDVRLASKQYPEAVASYKKAMAQSPRSQLLMKEYIAIQNSGKVADADALLTDWLRSHPSDTDARRFEGDQAMLSTSYGKAITSYRVVLVTQPNDVAVLNNLAWALWHQKDPQALATAEKARSLAPDSSAVNHTLGWILVDKGEVPKGLELLQKALSAAPDQPVIALHVAKAQIRNGQKDAARGTMQALVRSAPASPEAKESKALMATL